MSVHIRGQVGVGSCKRPGRGRQKSADMQDRKGSRSKTVMQIFACRQKRLAQEENKAVRLQKRYLGTPTQAQDKTPRCSQCLLVLRVCVWPRLDLAANVSSLHNDDDDGDASPPPAAARGGAQGAGTYVRAWAV